MSTPLPRPVTQNGLFLWVMHRFAEVFEEHAVLKGGMALRLFDCPRATNDVDYLFVPFASKKAITNRIEAVLRELDGAAVQVDVHSKMVRARLTVDGASIQIEVNVSMQCDSVAVPTGAFAASVGQPSRIVRVMSPAVAMAHKLAAWNERRLLRDLYDVYFLSSRLGAQPDRSVLLERLEAIRSRLPELRGRQRMDLAEFTSELGAAAAALDEARIRSELAPLLPSEELPALELRIRSAVIRVAEGLTP